MFLMLNSFESYKINEEVPDNFNVDTVYATVCGDEHDGSLEKDEASRLKGPTTVFPYFQMSYSQNKTRPRCFKKSQTRNKQDEQGTHTPSEPPSGRPRTL